MKLKRFYQYVESNNYDVESVMNNSVHQFVAIKLVNDYDKSDTILFKRILEKNFNSDLVSKEIRAEILQYCKSNDLETFQFLNEGFFDSIKKGWNNVKDKAKELSSQAKNTIGTIVQKAKDAVDFVKKIKNYVVDIFKKLVETGIEKLTAKLKLNKDFVGKVEETATKNKEGLKKDLTTSKMVVEFYHNKMLGKINDNVEENAIEIAEGEPAPEDLGAKPGSTPPKEVEVGQKYMYLNSEGKNIEVVVLTVANMEKDLVEVSSENSKEPFKVKKDKLTPLAEESLKKYNDLFQINESLLGSFIHKLETIPPFSWLAKVKEAGEKGANLIITVLSEVTAKLGGPKFVLPVLAALLGIAFEQYIKGMAKEQLLGVAVYTAVPFMVPIVKFLGFVAMFIAAVLVIDEVTNLGIMKH